MIARTPAQARIDRLTRASRWGFVDGVGSAFSVLGKGHPAPPRVHRGIGSLADDARAIHRDSERLVHGRP